MLHYELLTMKLRELRNTEPPESLPKLRSTEIEIIWLNDYYDGPMSGILRFNEELFWFDATQFCDTWEESGWHRRFGIVRLSKKELSKEMEVHEDFERYVGLHNSFVHLKPPPKFEKNKQDLFYEKHQVYCNGEHFEDNELIGWTER